MSKNKNPMFTKKGAWLWFICAPLAFMIAVIYDYKQDMAKWEKKRKEKEEAFQRKFPEFDYWQDNEDL